MALWLTGGSLAHSDTLADEGDFQKQPSGERCLRCAPNRRLTFCYGSIRPAAALMDAISIFHGRGAPILTGAEGICHVRSTLFSPISCGRAHLCWQRTRWEDVIQSVLLRFNYFYPRFGFCGAGMTSLLHFHVESFIRRRVGGWPPLKSVPSPHTSITHPCWLPLDRMLYGGRPSTSFHQRT